jgi:methylated-DNA-[protein]-cysteine S-methyltransferase
MESCTISTPIGLVRLAGSGRGLTEVVFVDDGPQGGEPSGLLRAAADDLIAYFAGTLRSFTVPLDPAGTEFQRAVWRELAAIPFGSTVTYGQIARRVGRPRGSQAVGLANGSNKLAIFLPCHRVVGSDGRLTGYAGGIERKKWLLQHESATLL